MSNAISKVTNLKLDNLLDVVGPVATGDILQKAGDGKYYPIPLPTGGGGDVSGLAAKNAANTFQGDFNQTFSDESGNTAVKIWQASKKLTIHDDGGVQTIEINGVTGAITATSITLSQPIDASVLPAVAARTDLANIFAGDLNQVFRDEAGNTAVKIWQAGKKLTVHDDGGVQRIELNGPTGIVSAPGFSLLDGSMAASGTLAWNNFTMNAGTVTSSATSVQTLAVTYTNATGQSRPVSWTFNNNATSAAGMDGFYINVVGAGGSATDYIARWQFGGADRFRVDTTGYLTVVGAFGIFATAATNAGEKFGLGATIGATTPNLSTAIGASATADQRSTALGASTTANQFYSLAVGAQASATGAQATAIGGTANASGSNAFALGKGATASGGSSIALGCTATTEQAVCRIGNVETAIPQKLVLAGRVDSTYFDAVGIMPSMIVSTYAGRTLQVIHQSYDFAATREYMRTVTTGTRVVTSLNGTGGPVLIGTNTEDGSSRQLQIAGAASASAFVGEIGRSGITYRQATPISVDTVVVSGGIAPYDLTITDVILKADVSTTSTFEIYVDGTKVSGTDPVTLTAGTSVTKSSFTGWTLNVNKGQQFGYKLTANNNALVLTGDIVYKHR